MKILTNESQGVEITFKDSRSNSLKEANSTTIKYHEKAVDEFYKTLYSLRDFVPELCELPKEYAYGMYVRGVKFDYMGEQLVMAASIIVRKDMKHCPGSYKIETPMKPSKAREGKKDDKFFILPEEVKNILETLLELGEAYLDGARAEMPLLADEQEPTPIPEMKVETRPRQMDLAHDSVSVAG